MNNNELVIKEWMITKLNLKGTCLIIYALIYNNVYNKKREINETCDMYSLGYFEKWSKSTRQGVIGALKKLIDSKLIYKQRGYPNNEYFINWKVIEEVENINE